MKLNSDWTRVLGRKRLLHLRSQTMFSYRERYLLHQFVSCVRLSLRVSKVRHFDLHACPHVCAVEPTLAV